MNLNFRCLTGNTYSLNFNPSATISDVSAILKNMLPEEEKIFELYYKRKPIEPTLLINELGIKSEEFITIKPIQQEEILEIPIKKNPSKKRGLPPRTEIKIPETDPDDFNELVLSLMEMGFEKVDCEKALRFSFYNLDRAGMYLVNGAIPNSYSPEFNYYNENPKKNEIQEEDLLKVQDLVAKTGEDIDFVYQTYLTFEKDVQKTLECLLNSIQ